MSNQRLKNCPHCGGMAHLEQNFTRKTHNYIVYVKCDICGAQGKVYSSEEAPAETEWQNEACNAAAAAWNLRTAEAQA